MADLRFCAAGCKDEDGHPIQFIPKAEFQDFHTLDCCLHWHRKNGNLE